MNMERTKRALLIASGYTLPGGGGVTDCYWERDSTKVTALLKTAKELPDSLRREVAANVVTKASRLTPDNRRLVASEESDAAVTFVDRLGGATVHLERLVARGLAKCNRY